MHDQQSEAEQYGSIELHFGEKPGTQSSGMELSSGRNYLYVLCTLPEINADLLILSDLSVRLLVATRCSNASEKCSYPAGSGFTHRT